MKPADQRFAELLFDVSKPEQPKPKPKQVDAPRPSRSSDEWNRPLAGVEDDLPPVPELGDVRTILLVRKAIHVMRGGVARDVRKEDMDNALAIFDRALAALLEKLEEPRRARGW